MSEIIETDSPDPADIAVIADGLRAYNTAMAGHDDYRPLAVFVTDPATGKVLGGLYGVSSRGQLRVDRFFFAAGVAPRPTRQPPLEDGRARRSAAPLHAGDLTVNTMEIQAPG